MADEDGKVAAIPTPLKGSVLKSLATGEAAESGATGEPEAGDSNTAAETPSVVASQESEVPATATPFKGSVLKSPAPGDVAERVKQNMARIAAMKSATLAVAPTKKSCC
jgi:hypothetical protein